VAIAVRTSPSTIEFYAREATVSESRGYAVMKVSILSSPRRRRKLMWLGGAVACAGVIALGIVLLPTHGSSRSGVQSPPKGFSLTTPSPTTSSSGTGAPVAAIQRLDDEFVNDLVQRKNLSRAHSLLAANLRSRYLLADWRAGHDLPISVNGGRDYRAASIVSFYGPKHVGLVSSLSPRFGAQPQEQPLAAVRFAKTDGRWLVEYVQQGHGTRLIDQTNYAPPGFLPGSHRQTFWDWAILGLIGVALIAVVAFLDRLLSRKPKGSLA
jgi:hypothetical protein